MKEIKSERTLTTECLPWTFRSLRINLSNKQLNQNNTTELILLSTFLGSHPQKTVFYLINRFPGMSSFQGSIESNYSFGNKTICSLHYDTFPFSNIRWMKRLKILSNCNIVLSVACENKEVTSDFPEWKSNNASFDSSTL
ncbi:hypothetical protein YC2023_015947 [Brassica napus]